MNAFTKTKHITIAQQVLSREAKKVVTRNATRFTKTIVTEAERHMCTEYATTLPMVLDMIDDEKGMDTADKARAVVVFIAESMGRIETTAMCLILSLLHRGIVSKGEATEMSKARESRDPTAPTFSNAMCSMFNYRVQMPTRAELSQVLLAEIANHPGEAETDMDFIVDRLRKHA